MRERAGCTTPRLSSRKRRRPPISIHFPYTTLFRSNVCLKWERLLWQSRMVLSPLWELVTDARNADLNSFTEFGSASGGTLVMQITRMQCTAIKSVPLLHLRLQVQESKMHLNLCPP